MNEPIVPLEIKCRGPSEELWRSVSAIVQAGADGQTRVLCPYSKGLGNCSARDTSRMQCPTHCPYSKK